MGKKHYAHLILRRAVSNIIQTVEVTLTFQRQEQYHDVIVPASQPRHDIVDLQDFWSSQLWNDVEESDARSDDEKESESQQQNGYSHYQTPKLYQFSHHQ